MGDWYMASIVMTAIIPFVFWYKMLHDSVWRVVQSYNVDRKRILYDGIMRRDSPVSRVYFMEAILSGIIGWFVLVGINLSVGGMRTSDWMQISAIAGVFTFVFTLAYLSRNYLGISFDARYYIISKDGFFLVRSSGPKYTDTIIDVLSASYSSYFVLPWENVRKVIIRRKELSIELFSDESFSFLDMDWNAQMIYPKKRDFEEVVNAVRRAVNPQIVEMK